MPKSAPIKKEQKETAPTATVKGPQGRMNRRLKQISDLYIERHPGKATRWVFSPEHKPDLSNVISRQADGYELVFNRDLGEDFVASLPGLKADQPARIGDVVLMSIAEEVQKAFQAESDQRSKDELERVEQEFYDNIDGMEVPNMREEHRARPRGRSLIEEVVRDTNVDPSLSDRSE